jgi:hypothetical protein
VKVFVTDGVENGFYKELLLNSDGIPPFLEKDKELQHFYFELTKEDKEKSKAITVNFYQHGIDNGGVINWVMLTHNTSQYEELLFPAEYDKNRNENILSVEGAFKSYQNIPGSNILAWYLIRD